MNFLDFYNQHYISLTFIIIILVGVVTSSIIYFFRKSNKKVKTPWFEIAPDSVNVPESEDMGKTRLLLKRQFEYVDNYINGLSNTFLALEKEIVDDAMRVLFQEKTVPKTHMQTCLINSNTNRNTKVINTIANIMSNHSLFCL
jgi:hypothetical protein